MKRWNKVKNIALFIMIVMSFITLGTVMASTVIQDEGVYKVTNEKSKIIDSIEITKTKFIKDKETKVGIRKKGSFKNGKIEISTSNSNILQVIDNEKLIVKGVSYGSCELIVKHDTGVIVKKTVYVQPKSIYVYDENDERIKSSIQLEKNSSIKVTLKDSDGQVLNGVTYKSKNEAKVQVDSSGRITAISGSKSAIKIEATYCGKKINIKVIPQEKVQGILAIDNITIPVKKSVSISKYATVNPITANNTKLKGKSENESIAKINGSKIVGVSEGVTYVNVISAENEEITSRIRINVVSNEQYDENIINDSLSDDEELVLVSGKEEILDNLTEQIKNVCTLKSSNSSIVSVSNDENILKVTGKRAGSAKVYIILNGVVYKEISVRVLAEEVDDVTKSKILNNTYQEIESIELPVDSKTQKQIKQYDMEVDCGYVISANIKPYNYDKEDLKYEITGAQKDFFTIYEQGDNYLVKASEIGKSADLIISSKLNPKINVKIKLRSYEGEIAQISFLDTELKIDYNEVGFSKVPLYVAITTQNGKYYNPESTGIYDTEVYEKLLKNVKLEIDNQDYILAGGQNILSGIKLKGNSSGSGIIRAVCGDVSAEIRYNAIGQKYDKVKDIKFAKSQYNLYDMNVYTFYPDIIMESGKVYKGSEEYNNITSEYQDLLQNVYLEEINYDYGSKGYKTTRDVLSITSDKKSAKAISSGICKLKIVYQDDNIKLDDMADINVELKEPAAASSLPYYQGQIVINDYRFLGKSEYGTTTGGKSKLYKAGTEVYVLAKDPKSNKCWAKYNNETFEISTANMIKYAPDTSGVASSVYATRYLAKGVVIRVGPGDSYRSVIEITNNGSKIKEITEYKDGWALVEYAEKYGYVRSENIYLTKNNVNNSDMHNGINVYNSNGSVNDDRMIELQKSLEKQYNLVAAPTDLSDSGTAVTLNDKKKVKDITAASANEDFFRISYYDDDGIPRSKIKLSIYQCPWWARGRADVYLSKHGTTMKMIPMYDSKGNYIGANGDMHIDVYGEGKYFASGSTPKENSLAVYEGGSNGGHVAYVEAVDNVNQFYYISHSGTAKKWFGITKLRFGASPWGYTLLGFVYLDQPAR